MVWRAVQPVWCGPCVRIAWCRAVWRGFAHFGLRLAQCKAGMIRRRGTSDMFTQRYALRKISRAKGASPFETPAQANACAHRVTHSRSPVIDLADGKHPNGNVETPRGALLGATLLLGTSPSRAPEHSGGRFCHLALNSRTFEGWQRAASSVTKAITIAMASPIAHAERVSGRRGGRWRSRSLCRTSCCYLCSRWLCCGT